MNDKIKVFYLISFSKTNFLIFKGTFPMGILLLNLLCNIAALSLEIAIDLLASVCVPAKLDDESLSFIGISTEFVG